MVDRGGTIMEEVLGDQTSYTHQVASVSAFLQEGGPFPLDIDASVANAEMIDECYRPAGLELGGAS